MFYYAMPKWSNLYWFASWLQCKSCFVPFWGGKWNGWNDAWFYVTLIFHFEFNSREKLPCWLSKHFSKSSHKNWLGSVDLISEIKNGEYECDLCSDLNVTETFQLFSLWDFHQSVGSKFWTILWVIKECYRI